MSGGPIRIGWNCYMDLSRRGSQSSHNVALLASLLGQHVADETARIMECRRTWRGNLSGIC
jgi:hypothetical protein